MSRRKKKKRRKSLQKNNITTKENLLKEEVNVITKKVNEEESVIYDLRKKQKNVIEKIVDYILLNNKMKNLLEDYSCINSELEVKIESQEKRKKDLELKKNKLEKLTNEEIKDSEFLKIGDVDFKIGLYNQECKCPVAICKQKEVYLSYDDIEYKGCLKHKDNKPCKHITWLKSDETLY